VFAGKRKGPHFIEGDGDDDPFWTSEALAAHCDKACSAHVVRAETSDMELDVLNFPIGDHLGHDYQPSSSSSSSSGGSVGPSSPPKRRRQESTGNGGGGKCGGGGKGRAARAGKAPAGTASGAVAPLRSLACGKGVREESFVCKRPGCGSTGTAVPGALRICGRCKHRDLDGYVTAAFGFAPRPQQKKCINLILDDRNVAVYMPTGRGKSLIYQVVARVAATETNRLTVYVVPQLSLGQDQARSLRSRGIRAVALTGSSSPGDRGEAHSMLQECGPSTAGTGDLLQQQYTSGVLLVRLMNEYPFFTLVPHWQYCLPPATFSIFNPPRPSS
jgi:hypothetical protein